MISHQDLFISRATEDFNISIAICYGEYMGEG